MGPIGVAKHLVPFLPNHEVVSTSGEEGISAVSAAPLVQHQSCLFLMLIFQ
jgi:glycine dehydrogenase